MENIKRCFEMIMRSCGRQRIKWRLYVEAVQNARYDDDLLPSDAELAAKAKCIEAAIYREYFADESRNKDSAS